MRLGNEAPRIYTPPLRELTPDTSIGYEIITAPGNRAGGTFYLPIAFGAIFDDSSVRGAVKR